MTNIIILTHKHPTDIHPFISYKHKKDKLQPDAREHLRMAGVVILPYEQAPERISTFSSSKGSQGQQGRKVWMDGKNTNSAIYNCLEDR